MHTLEGRDYSRDSDDYSTICRQIEKLDDLCAQLKATKKLTELFDYTEQTFDWDKYEANSAGDESDLDPETELAYGIDDMKWFDAKEGITLLRQLRESVTLGSLAKLSSRHRAELLEELSACISRLEGPAQRGGKFHFTLVD